MSAKIIWAEEIERQLDHYMSVSAVQAVLGSGWETLANAVEITLRILTL